MASSYDIGDRVNLQVTLTDTEGEVLDPDDVICTVRAPGGTESAPEVSNPEPGVYTATVEPDASGTWYYRFAGTDGSGNLVAQEKDFVVKVRKVGA